jgi:hypothetical protein
LKVFNLIYREGITPLPQFLKNLEVSVIVKNNKTFVTRVEGITLYPGTNTLNENQSQRLSQSPAFEDKIDVGALSILGQNGDEEEIQHSNPEVIQQVVKKVERIDIKKLNVENAAKVIRSMYNVAELREILKNDTRKGVQEVVVMQLKRIDEAVVRKEDEE